MDLCLVLTNWSVAFTNGAVFSFNFDIIDFKDKSIGDLLVDQLCR